MSDGFGRNLSAGAVAGPVVAALLAGSAAYAVQQDSFAASAPAEEASASRSSQQDQALVALEKAVKKQERQLAKMRSDLRHTKTAAKRTSRQAAAVAARSSGSTWAPSTSASSGWTSSGSASGGGSSSGGSSGGGTASTTQPSTQGTTGASGA